MSETVNQGNSTGNQGNTTGSQAAGGQQGDQGNTFTQEQLDRIVKERVYRETSKYADYEDLKAKAAKYDELEEAGKSELEKMTNKASELEQELNELKKQDQARSLRDKVAKETGVPAHLLTADTEDGCKDQAKAILEFSKGGSYPDLQDGGEPQHGKGGKTRDQFADWAAKAFK